MLEHKDIVISQNFYSANKQAYQCEQQDKSKRETAVTMYTVKNVGEMCIS